MGASRMSFSTWPAGLTASGIHTDNHHTAHFITFLSIRRNFSGWKIAPDQIRVYLCSSTYAPLELSLHVHTCTQELAGCSVIAKKNLLDLQFWLSKVQISVPEILNQHTKSRNMFFVSSRIFMLRSLERSICSMYGRGRFTKMVERSLPL